MEIPKDIANAKVSDFILESKEWDIPKLEEVLPQDKVGEVRAILIPTKETVEDAMFWAESTTGNFSLSSAFCTVAGTKYNDEDLS